MPHRSQDSACSSCWERIKIRNRKIEASSKNHGAALPRIQTSTVDPWQDPKQMFLGFGCEALQGKTLRAEQGVETSGVCSRTLGHKAIAGTGSSEKRSRTQFIWHSSPGRSAAESVHSSFCSYCVKLSLTSPATILECWIHSNC